MKKLLLNKLKLIELNIKLKKNEEVANTCWHNVIFFKLSINLIKFDINNNFFTSDDFLSSKIILSIKEATSSCILGFSATSVNLSKISINKTFCVNRLFKVLRNSLSYYYSCYFFLFFNIIIYKIIKYL